MGPERLAQAAFWYYVQELTQEEIARRLGVSRSNVSRILQAARDAGIIRFEIRHPLSRDADLEHALMERFAGFGITEAVVAVPPASLDVGSTGSGLFAVARETAEWMRVHLREGQTLGLSWGSTIGTIVEAAYFAHGTGVHVVQLGGEVSLDPRHSGHDLTRDMAGRLGGSYRYFNAPAVAPTAAAAAALRQSPQVGNALEAARQVDVALVGIGAYGAATSLMFLEQAKVTPAEKEEAERKGAVGQVVGRFFDAEGRQLALSLHDRVLSVDVQDLARTPTVVMAAAGEDKRDAVAAALRGGFVDVVVVDTALAHGVLSVPAAVPPVGSAAAAAGAVG